MKGTIREAKETYLQSDKMKRISSLKIMEVSLAKPKRMKEGPIL
jgi:hypothetical protein